MGLNRALADPYFTMVAYLGLVSLGTASLRVSNYAIASVFGTIAWAGFFHCFRILMETQFPKTRALVDPKDPTWSVAAAYVSFFHQFVLCLGFGVYFLAAFHRDIWWWVQPMPGDDWMFRRAEQHLFYATMGYELKDFFVGIPILPLLIHHIVTILGCTQCLLTPAGAGLACVNCINAQIGSGFYNIYAFSLTKKWLTPAYWTFVVVMTASNTIALWLMVEYDYFDIPLVWRVCYSVAVVALCLIRQGNVFLTLRTCGKPPAAKKTEERPPDETTPVSSSTTSSPSTNDLSNNPAASPSNV